MDLVVTGGHPLLVTEISEREEIKNNQFYNKPTHLDGYIRLLTVINDRAKLNTSLPEGIYDIYDIILEDGQKEIYANGILTESMDEDHFKKHTAMKIVSGKH